MQCKLSLANSMTIYVNPDHLYSGHALLCAGALKVLAVFEDSRPRIIKATKDWNWRPLVGVLEHEDVRLPFVYPSLLVICCVLTTLL